ncbi:MAG: bifunctional DNA primase/polymerase [Desertimonas sp.]
MTIRDNSDVVPTIETLLNVAGHLPVREAAVRYAAAGVAVFPCVPDAKRPLVPEGFLAATADQRQVARWWARWPEANIGVPTGGGVDVVDVDRRGSASGFAPLERARLAGLTEGWEAIVRTPSGGVHLYYPADAARPQGSWSVGEVHLDFRGMGGYVLVPPSRVVTGGRVGGYELIAVGQNPRPVDGVALRDFFRPPRRLRPITDLPPVRGVGEQRIASWLASRPEGARNRALFWAACRYAESAVPEGHAYELLGAAAERAGLADAEIAATIRSAYRSAPPSPAGRSGRPAQVGIGS